MLFNSVAFLLFLPCVFALYWLSRHHGLRLLVILAASYVFYGWTDARFLPLIAGMTLLGYGCGLWAEAAGPRSRGARHAVAMAAVVSLGILAAFKYYNFFLHSVEQALQAVGLHFTPEFWQVALPVGISFYTFQTLAYVVDVYRGEVQAERNLLQFAAFVAFFPQLVAGPIERARHLLPQFSVVQRFDYGLAADGLRQMLWGFVKKVLVADRCAVVVNAVYANPAADGTDLWAASVLFAFQIYGDFSGYSDIAVGCGKLFGIRLSRNFNVPYFSRNVAEFWRRWHISLMSWFRDYLYIPLGGSRCGRLRHVVNVFVVFLASGLWHGANWTFVMWGLYHAVLFVPLVLLNVGRNSANCSVVAEARLLPTLREGTGMLLTFALVVVGWVFFRSASLHQAFAALGRMFTDVHAHTPYGGLSAFALPLGMLAWEWVERRQPHALCWRGTGLARYRAMRWAVYYALIFAMLAWGGEPATFIYFQF